MPPKKSTTKNTPKKAAVASATASDSTTPTPAMNRVIPKKTIYKAESHKDPEIGAFTAIMTYFGYLLMIVIGHIRDFFAALTGMSRYTGNRNTKGYAVLLKSWESFFTRRLYHRMQDCWNRPISSGPGAYIDVMERISPDGNCTLDITGKSTRCLNLGSYNYLGFADDWKENCREDVVGSLDKWPISMSSPRANMGNAAIYEELEKRVANFVGKEAAMVFGMGYGTNLSTLAVLMGEGSLIISDSLNHTSIVNGSRASAAQIRVFRHNDVSNLEEVLREAIINGQPRFHRPWKKIMVVVEGIYSMEGVICRLDEVVKVCKKYKAYIYVDEAHSIGALGDTGRGVCEYKGVDTSEIDIMMGTFTKSFSGMGGYIAASKNIIAYLKANASGMLYSNPLSPTICQQVITAFKIIAGEDNTNVGQHKLVSLIENSNYFRSEMVKLGVHLYGQYDSPIVPMLIYYPAKVAAFSRECLKRGVAVVVVGFPATSVVLSRARFCISAGHTKADIDHAIKVIDEVTELLQLKYHKSILG